MIESRHVGKLVTALIALALAACLLAMASAQTLRAAFGGGGLAQEYETVLFDTSQILSVEIEMDPADWEELLADAISETYYTCDVTVNGTTFTNVGIRPKGNTSLSSIYNDPDTDRYSFKLEFDKYVTGQTCFGLDKLVLNNNYADATSMKEAVVYDMFAYLGADASLYNYAEISVNGAYWGCYLALEAVEDSFALRNYGTGYGEFYKPESMGGGGAGGMRDMDTEKLQEMMGQETGDGTQPAAPPTDASQTPPTQEDATAEGGAVAVTPAQAPTDGAPPTAGSFPGSRGGNGQRPEGGGGPGGMSGSGADLNYIDDDVDSYSTIWEGEVGSTKKADHQRVVTALKHISEKTDLETYMDVDNLLRYLAVQTFVVNLDGLAGNMAHNYYLYESDGQLNLVPWDYNLAFGAFQGGSASAAVNFPIDTPFSTGLEDRQFFAALLENQDYLAQYHEYLRILAEEYVGSGGFAATVSRIDDQISALVATDPTAFYTGEEYEAAVEMLQTTVKLRSQSVLGQLDGSVPATTDGQTETPDALVDASTVDIAVMGQMSMGGGRGGETGQETTAEQGNDAPAPTE